MASKKNSNMTLLIVGAVGVGLLVMATGVKASASVGVGKSGGATVEKGAWWKGDSGRIYVGYGAGEEGLKALAAENPEGFADVKKAIQRARRTM